MGTERQIGYGAANWVRSGKLVMERQIRYGTANWVRNGKLGTERQIGYGVANLKTILKLLFKFLCPYLSFPLQSMAIGRQATGRLFVYV